MNTYSRSQASDAQNKPDKGILYGSCNRTACQIPGAVWYNQSTRAFYCQACARLINQANPEGWPIGSMRPLCVMVVHPLDDLKGLSAANMVPGLRVRLGRQVFSEQLGAFNPGLTGVVSERVTNIGWNRRAVAFIKLDQDVAGMPDNLLPVLSEDAVQPDCTPAYFDAVE